jgi:hypothetical protein
MKLPRSRLTPGDCDAVLRLRARGWAVAALALFFGVSTATIEAVS